MSLWPPVVLAPTRNLTCVGCGTLIGILEIPAGLTDERSFRCIPCLEARHAEKAAKQDGRPKALAYGEFPEGY